MGTAGRFATTRAISPVRMGTSSRGAFRSVEIPRLRWQAEGRAPYSFKIPGPSCSTGARSLNACGVISGPRTIRRCLSYSRFFPRKAAQATKIRMDPKNASIFQRSGGSTHETALSTPIKTIK